ncbi:uncharacterized protein LOC120634860 isoform X2 [Pararge aegeria]|uniref:uncharacterized protein LOC120634860 isoform X2 n=1 Tax=Pararge aegeria TaxID=116150 RepID=UPI0019CF674A|nr:uncharacterized protein LOC120634860 isoform X2 [Pararge aegeria]
MKLVFIFCVCFAAALAVPAPVPDDDDHDQHQFDDQQQFRRRLQSLSLSRADRDNRRDQDDRPDHADRRDLDNGRDREDRRDRLRNLQLDHVDRRDLDDKRNRDALTIQKDFQKARDGRMDPALLQDRDDQPDRLQDRSNNDVLRNTHMDLISKILGRLTNKYQGQGSLKVSYNPVPLQPVIPLQPRVYDLGSLNFKYYAPASPVYHGTSLSSNEPHGLYLRALDEDRADDDDDDDDQL